jgi:lipopolysaccharide/colanic/teichoic acid biosynthesis glycosyltransferase
MSSHSTRTSESIRRVRDIALACVLLIVLSPMVLLVIVGIYLSDRGSVWFVQSRIGKDGQLFRMYKLRTMYRMGDALLRKHLENNLQARTEWATYLRLDHDPRVLGFVGRFARRSSLDEVPQLWNVLRGEMSMVGPRPFPPEHAALFDSPAWEARAQVLPGLTGLWQVSGRSNLDIPSMLALDVQYVERRSHRLDTWILLKTIPAVCSSKGAY